MMNPPDHRPPTHRRTDSVALGEDDALGAGIAGEGADARFFSPRKSSKGMQRIVTFSSSLIFASTSGLPDQWASANPPWISGRDLFGCVTRILILVHTAFLWPRSRQAEAGNRSLAVSENLVEVWPRGGLRSKMGHEHQLKCGQRRWDSDQAAAAWTGTAYTGLSSEAARDWGWEVAIHPEDLPRLLDVWHKLLASGEPGGLEARLRRFDGVYRWFLFRAEPLFDETGNIVKWYGTNTEVNADTILTRDGVRDLRNLFPQAAQPNTARA
jgi:PAS fold